MRIFRHYDALPEDARGAAVAIGNFDGVHRGHQAVIHEAGVIARDQGRPWAVLTFEPHPRKLFQPGQAPFRLTPFRTKVREIAQLGCDLLIVQRFNQAFSRQSAVDFVEGALVRGLQATHVISGYDFVFGHKRTGNCELLLNLGAERGFGFTCVNAVEDETGGVFSSTRVRESLGQGDPAGARAILGRDFELEGRVIKGEARGHKIGFPTANIHLGPFLRPRKGVYAVRVMIEEARTGEARTGTKEEPEPGAGGEPDWRNGVANIGVRPTFGGEDVVLEVFLFDFDGDLYGRRLRVRLVDFLRDEKKFDGPDDLKAQIASDSESARKILAA